MLLSYVHRGKSCCSKDALKNLKGFNGLKTSIASTNFFDLGIFKKLFVVLLNICTYKSQCLWHGHGFVGQHFNIQSRQPTEKILMIKYLLLQTHYLLIWLAGIFLNKKRNFHHLQK